MFELVDHWTVTASPEEYIAFADALVFHAKYPGQRGERRAPYPSGPMCCW